MKKYLIIIFILCVVIFYFLNVNKALGKYGICCGIGVEPLSPPTHDLTSAVYELSASHCKTAEGLIYLGNSFVIVSLIFAGLKLLKPEKE